MPEISQQSFWSGWQQRLNALRNIPPVLRIVWASGPPVIAAGLLFRVVSALIPVAMLSVSRLIIDAIVSSKAGKHALPQMFWWLVASEFALAALGSLLGRAIGFFDSLFADRFTRHVSIRVMEHASRLDLASYEDPVFYDKLERARVQATDRIAMISPTTGQVTGWINLSGLLPPADRVGVDVLNGIAYLPKRDQLFVTGKFWPKLFEIRLMPQS